MISKNRIRIITNNPLVTQCLQKDYVIDFTPCTYGEILIKVRDLVYSGHRLYTHPLSGSVKPNETPYKSIVVSRSPVGMENEEAELISNSIETFKKFPPCHRELTEEMRNDFQLIDYSLLCSALDLDAVMGLSNRRN